MMQNCAVVWIDHKEARIFHIEPDKVDSSVVAAPLHHVHHKHAQGESGGKEHPNDFKQFFREVAQALEGIEQVLIVGPSTAKLEFLRFVHHQEQALEPRIIGLETVDHPSDPQLIAYAKRYFKLERQLA